jgi:hypothetical protein
MLVLSEGRTRGLFSASWRPLGGAALASPTRLSSMVADHRNGVRTSGSDRVSAWSLAGCSVRFSGGLSVWVSWG